MVIGGLRLRQTPRKSNCEVERLDRDLVFSPTFLKLADSILKGLDRRTAGELLAGYLYFRSSGRSDTDYARYLLTNRLEVILRVIGNSLPILIPAVFSDRQLRTLIIEIVIRSVQSS